MKLSENEFITNDGKFHIYENFTINEYAIESAIKTKVLSEAKKGDGTSKLVLKPRILAIHAGRTRNDNIYVAEKLKGDFQLKSGIYSFTHPYPKPMLKNHDHYSEPTGRITNAQFIKDPLTNKESVAIIPEITDPDAIEKVLDGRYLTVSIGSTTDSVVCNICGTDLMKEGWCDHDKGKEYDGTVCGWIIGNVWFDECSWVNVPADQSAGVVDKGEPTTMEAYIYNANENKYFNISRDFDEINEEIAQVLGIYQLQESIKGGIDSVEKITITVEEHEKLKAFEGQVTDLTSKISEKDIEIAAANEELKLKQTESEGKDVIIASKDAEIATLTQEKTDLDQKIVTIESEKQELIDSGVTSEQELLKDLANKVVELKVMIGSAEEDKKEDLITDYVSRTKESLKDTYTDIISEFKGFINKIKLQSSIISNPGINIVTGENVDNNEEELDGAKVLKNLLTGKTTSKRKI